MAWLILAILACSGGDPPGWEAQVGTPPVELDRPQAHPARQRLEGARDRYQRIVDAGGWPTIGRGPMLTEGATGSEITRLRERLRITGDLPYADGGARFDRELAEALRRFQRRHGIEAHGRLDAETRATLDVPASERLARIEENLEAWDALDADFSEPHVLVNVPEFVLRVVDGGDETLEMRVVVGKEYDGHRTPSFSDAIEHVVFRPHWFVPQPIVSDEIVPHALSDPEWFESRAFQIVRDVHTESDSLPPTPENLRAAADGRLRVRQLGGELNALGLVKFMFPNEHAVYLHDTPSEELFDETERVASHGCVRVENPLALADFVLDRASGSWPPSRIHEAMHDGPVHQVVALEEPLPIHLGYWTVWADDDSGVHFRPDIYRRFSDEDAPEAPDAPDAPDEPDEPDEEPPEDPSETIDPAPSGDEAARDAAPTRRRGARIPTRTDGNLPMEPLQRPDRG